MRNTAILPGSSKLADMVAGVDDGYLLLNTSNGQADSTLPVPEPVAPRASVRGGRVARAGIASAVATEPLPEA